MMSQTHPPVTPTGELNHDGRTIARMAFALGIAVSIAANVAHTWHPSARVLEAAATRGIVPADWRPEIGAQLSAAFYPLALLLTVEILTRVAWRPGWRFALARFGGTCAVALVAAVVSYRHMAALLAAYGEDGLTAAIGPLAVDGLMVVASFALLSISHNAQPVAIPDATPALAPEPAAESAPVRALPAPRPSRPRTRKPKRPAPQVPDVADLMPAARKAAAQLADEGAELTRDRLAAALRAADLTVSNIKASALLAALKTETPAAA